jgi:hypothetical protein
VENREHMPGLDEVLNDCIGRGWQRLPGQPLPDADQIRRWVADGALVIFDRLDEALVHLAEVAVQQFTARLLRILPPVRAGTR